MVVLIADIEGNCFYTIVSILLVWGRSDSFNVSLKITGCVSLHNQPYLHITLSKLIFTSHCICFYYIMICPVSSAYTISIVSFAWPRYNGCWLWIGHFSGYLFPALFANQILICFMPTAHVSPVLPPLHLKCVQPTQTTFWTGHYSGFIVSGTVT